MCSWLTSSLFGVSGLMKLAPPWCSCLARAEGAASRGIWTRPRAVQLGRQLTRDFRAGLGSLDLCFSHSFISAPLFLVAARGDLVGCRARSLAGRALENRRSDLLGTQPSATRLFETGIALVVGATALARASSHHRRACQSEACGACHVALQAASPRSARGSSPGADNPDEPGQIRAPYFLTRRRSATISAA
jgi:hypothetical protein